MNSNNTDNKIIYTTYATTEEFNSIFRKLENEGVNLSKYKTEIGEISKQFDCLNKLSEEIQSLSSEKMELTTAQKLKKIERKSSKIKFYQQLTRIELGRQNILVKTGKQECIEFGKIDELKTKEDEKKQNIEILKSSIKLDKTEKLAKIASIKSKLTTISFELTKLVDKLENKKIEIFVEDSIVEINSREEFRTKLEFLNDQFNSLHSLQSEIEQSTHCSDTQFRMIQEMEDAIHSNFHDAILFALQGNENRIQELRSEFLSTSSASIDLLQADINALIALYHRVLGQVPTSPAEEIPLSPLWAFSDWGSLIGPDSGIDHLINSRIALLNSEYLDENEQKQLHSMDRILYHGLLNKTINAIHENNLLLRTESANLSEEQTLFIQRSLTLLNEKYDLFLECYKKIPVEEKSIASHLLGGLVASGKSIFTLGYLKEQIFPVEEIERRKKFADLGFDVMTECKNWLNSLTREENETYFDVIKREVEGFLAWAEKNPQEAMTIAGDIALTVAILQDESFMDQFHARMKTIAYVNAFQKGWNGGSSAVTPSPTEATLKYYALSQITRYAPMMAGIVKNLASTEQTGLTSVAVSIFKGVWEGSAVQAASSFIPHEQANLAFQAVNLVKGDLPQFFEEQRNVDLVQLAGITASFAHSPQGFFNRTLNELSIWWKTLRAATGREKIARIALQILLPIISLGAFALFAEPLILTAALAPSIAITLFTSSIKLAHMMEEWFAEKYTTRKDVMTEMERKEMETLRIARRKKVEEEIESIHEVRDVFVRKLRKANILPDEPIARVPLFSEATENTYLIIQDAVINPLKIEMNQVFDDRSAAGYVKRLVDVGMDKIKNAIELETFALPEDSPLRQKETQTQMELEIANRLVKEWLCPRLDRVFVEKTIDLSFENESVTGVNPSIDRFINDSLRQLDEYREATESTQGELRSQLQRFFGSLEVIA